MQLHQTILVAFLATLLTACGGSLDGGGDDPGTTDPEATDPEATDPEATDPEVPVAVSGDPSYFTYEGASPEWISIKGTGGLNRKETAIVTFKLVDDNGEAVVSQPVLFELSGPQGASLAIESDISDSDGLVTTLVKAGSAAGTAKVKVIAENEPTIFNTSTGLYISTGYPDQDSFSLAVDNSSPAALNHSDAKVAVTVNFADADGNTPVPDGTVVTFRAEAGRIEDSLTGAVSSCTTLKSECVMTWTSIGDMPDDGKVTLLAYAQGVESFKDHNPPNGVFDEGEVFTDNAEAFHDENSDGIYNDGDEWYKEGDDKFGVNDQAYTVGDGKYTGIQCADNVAYCSQAFVYIFKQTYLTASGDEQQCVFKNSTGNVISSVDLTSNSKVTVSLEVSDMKNNTPPMGTVISASVTNGALNGDSSWTVPNWIDGAYTFDVDVVREQTANTIFEGDLVIKVAAAAPATLVTTCKLSITD